MMRQSYLELKAGAFNQYARNVQIEVYHLHARNLIEFFKNKDPCDVDPRRFTLQGYEPDGNFIDNELEKKINRQISHLTAQRTTDTQEKLGPDQWSRIEASIEKQVTRFDAALTEQAREFWNKGIEDNDFSLKLYVSNQTASATNSIIVIKM
jgi:hypothetical protein